MPPPYSSVGRCIYCPATRYAADEPGHKLGDEHIIAAQIRGTLILPEASCKACEILTSGLETQVTALYDPGRHHLGIKGRKTRKPKTRLPIRTEDGSGTEKIDKENHPGAIFGFQFDFPGILLGLPPGGERTGRFQMAPAVSDFPERIRGLGRPFNLLIGNKVDAEIFRRVLAKIGHAFAVAELGLDGFTPLLLSAINGSRPDDLPWLVGSSTDEQDRGTGPEHEISFADLDPELVVVRVRLFARLGLSPHYVVAGRRRSSVMTSYPRGG